MQEKQQAFQQCYQILKSFSSRNVWILLKAYTTFIRPTVKYATTIWNPYIKKDKKTVERVQKFFTKQICQRCNIPFDSYSDRLYKLDLKTLEYRRLEFDILMFYKFMNGLVDIQKSEFFTMSASRYNTRSHELCIRPNLNNTNQLQHKFFINRCTSVWNNLPAELVKCSSYHLFRSKLKKFNLHKIAKLTNFDSYSLAYYNTNTIISIFVQLFCPKKNTGIFYESFLCVTLTVFTDWC